MEFTKFCPRCGKETDELFGGEKKLCAECYPDKNDLLDIPRELEITVCSVCGRMRYQGEWIEEYSVQDQLAKSFEKFSEEDVEMHLQYWEDEGFHVRVHAEKGPIKDFYDTDILFHREQCKACSRFQGGFFKVKMQLRGPDVDDISREIVDEAAEATNDSRKDFLSNIDEVHGGYNFYLSTERIAKKILTMLRDRYDPEIKRSYELIGEQNGEEVYRNVVSVRFD